MKAWFFSTLRFGFVFSMLLVACQPAAVPAVTPPASPETTPTATLQSLTEDPSPATASAERIKIRWFIGVGTGRTDSALNSAKTFVDKYNQSQDKIELSLEVVSSSTHDAIDKVLAEIKAGNAPDVIAPVDLGWAGEQLIEYILPLDPASFDFKDVDAKLLDSWRNQEGNLTGIPAGVFTSVIFYNKKLFDEANIPYPPHKFGEPYADGEPWTVEKLEKIALELTLDAKGKNATSPDFDPGSVTQWGYHWQWDSTRSMAVMFGAGSVVDANGKAVIPQPWREAFNWYYEGMWTKHFIPTIPNVNGSVLQGNPFRSGRVAMVSYFTFYTQRLNGTPSWDMAAVPAYQGKITSRMERDGVFVMKSTKYPEEAAKVAYAIATDPELILAWEMIPSFKSMQPSFFKGFEEKHSGVDWNVMVDSMNYADITYESGMPNYRKSYDRLLWFRDLLGSSGYLSLYNEIDKLEADLQVLFEEASTK